VGRGWEYETRLAASLLRQLVLILEGYSKCTQRWGNLRKLANKREGVKCEYLFGRSSYKNLTMSAVMFGLSIFIGECC
jgi:hypothetical protein